MKNDKTFCYVQCKANNFRHSAADEIGSFIGTFDKTPISPVFPDLLGLYAWMKENGWRFIPCSWEVVRQQ